MNGILKRVTAALALGSVMTLAVPAEAKDWRGDRGWSHGDRHWRGDGWRGDRWRGDRHWRGDRWGRGYGYYAPRRYYYAPRYYGYGYGYGPPRHRHYYRGHDGDVLVGALAGIAIGAAIASSD
jgi:hypothetical protein